MTERSEGIGKHSTSGHLADAGGLTTERSEGIGKRSTSGHLADAGGLTTGRSRMTMTEEGS
jgi:hypothetical protein